MAARRRWARTVTARPAETRAAETRRASDDPFTPTTYELPVEPTALPPGEYWVVGFFGEGSIVGSSPPGTGGQPNILTAPQAFEDGFPATITNAAIGTNIAPNVFVTAAL